MICASTKDKIAAPPHQGRGRASRSVQDVRKELDVLHRITESISANLDMDRVLSGIVQMGVEVAQADACLIYLLDETRQELVLRASSLPHPKLIGRVALAIGEGVTGWVARENKTVAISKNAWNDPRFMAFSKLPEDRFQAFLSVPIASKGGIIGVVNVHHRKPHKHSPREIAMLTTIGRQVGGAIENAMAHESIQRKVIQLETLARVSHTIAFGHYLEDILNLIVMLTAGMLGSKVCSIMTLDASSEKLDVVATQSLSPAYRAKESVRVGESISGRAVRERHPIFIEDVRRDPDYRFPDLAKTEGLCSLLCMPIRAKDRILGVINVYTATLHRFTQEETSILETIAHQAAVAIENTRLMERAAAMQESLETQKSVQLACTRLTEQAKMTKEASLAYIQRQAERTEKTTREIADALLLALQLTGTLPQEISHQKTPLPA